MDPFPLLIFESLTRQGQGKLFENLNFSDRCHRKHLFLEWADYVLIYIHFDTLDLCLIRSFSGVFGISSGFQI